MLFDVLEVFIVIIICWGKINNNNDNNRAVDVYGISFPVLIYLFLTILFPVTPLNEHYRIVFFASKTVAGSVSTLCNPLHVHKTDKPVEVWDRSAFWVTRQ